MVIFLCAAGKWEMKRKKNYQNIQKVQKGNKR